MYIPFEEIADSSRVWVFQSQRVFSEKEIKVLNEKLLEFTTYWTSHNQVLETSFKVDSDRFIILAVNESVNDASGCSIDKSVSLIKDLEMELNLSLLDKSIIVYETADGMKSIKLSDIKTEIALGNINEMTFVYNTLIATKSEYLLQFKLPVAQTWLKRYFAKATF